MVRELTQRNLEDLHTTSEVDLILSIQQLDFAVETLLRTVASQYGRPSMYAGSQSDYQTPMRQLTSQALERESKFPRSFDESLRYTKTRIHR